MLDPDVERYLAGLADRRAPRQPDLATLRREYNAAAPGLFGPAPMSTRSRTTTPTASRSASTAGGGERAALVYLHGGGWVLGGLDSHGPVVPDAGRPVGPGGGRGRLPAGARAPLSGGGQDAWTAFRWAHERFDQLAVGGDSAGGHLSATVARRARDAGWRWRCRCSRYPATEPWLRVAVLRQIRDRAGVPSAEMSWSWEQFLDDPSRVNEPDCSPLARRPVRDGTGAGADTGATRCRRGRGVRAALRAAKCR